jgi:hypothetical protein
MKMWTSCWVWDDGDVAGVFDSRWLVAAVAAVVVVVVMEAFIIDIGQKGCAIVFGGLVYHSRWFCYHQCQARQRRINNETDGVKIVVVVVIIIMTLRLEPEADAGTNPNRQRQRRHQKRIPTPTTHCRSSCNNAFLEFSANGYKCSHPQ